jgi:hypothetical protein
MCKAKLDERACERTRELRTLDLSAKLSPASTLPCGTFKSTVSSLTGDLSFLDKGIVTLEVGNRARARLEDGFVKVRHDKGGDFMFMPLDPDVLLGMDDWNQFEVYRRVQSPKITCVAPVLYKEAPLSSGCGLGQDPKTCCQTGDTQGCNRLGTMLALEGNWQAAADNYAKVCAHGVRVGCENWIHTVSKTGEAQAVKSGLSRLCRRSRQHVACDVLDTTNFEMLKLTHELEKAAQE